MLNDKDIGSFCRVGMSKGELNAILQLTHEEYQDQTYPEEIIRLDSLLRALGTGATLATAMSEIFAMIAAGCSGGEIINKYRPLMQQLLKEAKPHEDSRTTTVDS